MKKVMMAVLVLGTMVLVACTASHSPGYVTAQSIDPAVIRKVVEPTPLELACAALVEQKKAEFTQTPMGLKCHVLDGSLAPGQSPSSLAKPKDGGFQNLGSHLVDIEIKDEVGSMIISSFVLTQAGTPASIHPLTLPPGDYPYKATYVDLWYGAYNNGNTLYGVLHVPETSCPDCQAGGQKVEFIKKVQ